MATIDVTDMMKGRNMKQMLNRQVLVPLSVLMLGLACGCAPIDDRPTGPPAWPAPDPVYQTPRQYGGAPWVDLGYYDQPIEPTSRSTDGASGPEPTGSSTAGAATDMRR